MIAAIGIPPPPMAAAATAASRPHGGEVAHPGGGASKVLPHPEFKVASGVQEVPLKSSMVGAGDDASAAG